jgi:large subunit ribosomal protein L3
MNIVSIATWKRGMTQVVHGGAVVPVTLLEVKPHELFRIKTKKTDGYNAICFSAGEKVKIKNTSKPMLKQFEAKSLAPREDIFEVRVNSNSNEFSIEGGAVMEDFFESLVNTKVDAQGINIGKGFAGVMKRWNFRGLEATHGVSITHRSHGSTGQRQDPGKVFKGKKMAGRLGSETTTVQNLDVVFFDKELNLIGVKGAVPGNDGGVVYIKNAVKKTSVGMPQNVNGLKIIYS